MNLYGSDQRSGAKIKAVSPNVPTIGEVADLKDKF